MRVLDQDSEPLAQLTFTPTIGWFRQVKSFVGFYEADPCNQSCQRTVIVSPQRTVVMDVQSGHGQSAYGHYEICSQITVYS